MCLANLCADITDGLVTVTRCANVRFVQEMCKSVQRCDLLGSPALTWKQLFINKMLLKQ